MSQQNETIRAAVFDLDRTLCKQSDEYISRTVNTTLADLGLHADDGFAFDFWYGSNRDRMIEDKFHIPYMDFWNVFWKHDSPQARVAATVVYDDVSVLNTLYFEKGMKLGIVTKAMKDVAYGEIEKVKERVPHVVFGSVVPNMYGQVVPNKPNPLPLFMCLRELGVAVENAVYIGDAQEDVDMIERAEIRGVIVVRDRDRTVDTHSNPDMQLICSLYELGRVL